MCVLLRLSSKEKHWVVLQHWLVFLNTYFTIEWIYLHFSILQHLREWNKEDEVKQSQTGEVKGDAYCLSLKSKVMYIYLSCLNQISTTSKPNKPLSDIDIGLLALPAPCWRHVNSKCLLALQTLTAFHWHLKVLGFDKLDLKR